MSRPTTSQDLTINHRLPKGAENTTTDARKQADIDTDKRRRKVDAVRDCQDFDEWTREVWQ